MGKWLRARWLEVLLIVGLLALLAWYAGVGMSFLPKPVPTATPLPTPTLAPPPTPTHAPPPTPVLASHDFDGAAAYEYVKAQVALGARPAGSEAGRKTGDLIARALGQAGWQVETQGFTYKGVQARNVIGRAGKGPVLIVGAHYDTRRLADNDPDPSLRTQPVMGANDGASGVAVLLELARVLDRKVLTNEVWLAFFDAEDNGEIDGWDWSAGAHYMADHLTVKPQGVIVIDMIGDADQQIYKERNSTPALQDPLYEIAAGLGYGKYFIPDYKWSMTDDHTPFLAKGLPAVDVIDFDYPYWHTTQDTADKVSADSLERVGRVLQVRLEGENPNGTPTP